MSRRKLSSKQCIYCLETKNTEHFQRKDHVLPKAFGSFKNNFTLNCVCDDCNQHFGNTIELRLGRDSIEGFERLRLGFIPSKDFKTLGTKTRTKSIIAEGPYKGAHVINNGKSLLESNISLQPQIGFSKFETGPFEWYKTENIPSREEMKTKGYESGSKIFNTILGLTLDEACLVLKNKGYNVSTDSNQINFKSNLILCETVTIIDHEIYRAISKIAFNYLTNIMGASTALMPQFNNIRRYIRYGDISEYSPAEFSNMPILGDEGFEGNRRICHLVTLQWKNLEKLVTSQVSLFNNMQYLVTLANGGFLIEPKISSGHLFDLSNKVIQPIKAGPRTKPL